MAKRRKTETKSSAPEKDRPAIHEGACGIRLDNINPVLPPDNEYTGAATVALAKAVSDIATSITAAARALEEAARHSQKSGVFIGNTSISNVS